MPELNGDDIDNLDFDAARAHTERELLLLTVMATKEIRADVKLLAQSVSTCQGQRRDCVDHFAKIDRGGSRREGAEAMAKYLIATLLATTAVCASAIGILYVAG